MSAQSDVLSMYFEDIKKMSLLSREEEELLVAQVKAGDKKALDKLVHANLRFVIQVAKKYQGQGLELEDLISEGNLGLIEAAKRFQPERGYHFITYAVHWIRQSILKAIAEKGKAIRLPQNRINELSKINQMRSELLDTYERDASNNEIAENLGLRTETVDTLMSMSQQVSSLSYSNDEQEGGYLSDSIADDSLEAVDDQLYDKALKEQIDRLLATLTDRESEIIQYRYGLGNKRRMSLKELGSLYNLTKERIRQIEKAAILKLQSSPEAEALRSFA